MILLGKYPECTGREYIYSVIVGRNMLISSNWLIVLLNFLKTYWFSLLRLSYWWSNSYWEREYMEISRLLTVDFFLKFSQFLLHIFWGSLVKSPYVYNYYSFLRYSTFYHCKRLLLVVMFIFLKSVLAYIKIIHSSCLHGISFSFQPVCVTAFTVFFL